MISYLWKYRYVNLLLIVITLFLCLLNLNKVHVYFDSERLIELADFDKDIIQKSLDDKNLVLVALEYNDSLTYKDMDAIFNKLLLLKKNKDIAFVRSLFNEEYFLPSLLFPVSERLLDIRDSLSYISSIKKIKSVGSNYLTEDFKSLLFVIKARNVDSEYKKNTLLNYLEGTLKMPNSKIYITGQIKSEIYMQKNVVQELIVFTLSSIVLCSIILWFFTSNIYLVFVNLISVFISVFFAFSLSNFLFEGIELVMIIIPAVIFIITISDYMHLQNIDMYYKNKYRFFLNQIKKIGFPVFLTSITTAIGFLSFTFLDFQPLMRFGVVTTLSIFIALFIIVTFFSVCVDFNLFRLKKDSRKTSLVIDNIMSIKRTRILLFLFLVLSSFGLYNFTVNNYLTDEFNTKSDLLNEIKYFDNNFGGIKPISINLYSETERSTVNTILEEIKREGLNVDFKFKREGEFIIGTRMKDIGSLESNQVYANINSLQYDNINVVKSIGGIGFLFDEISNELTFDVLSGLVLAIIIIGILFVLLNGFNLNYFYVSLIPNLIPLFTCLGFLTFSDFYFSLSNAFIFAIVFGLIVDDSIHIISAYSICRNRKFSIYESLLYCKKNTFKAVFKTTVVIIFTLLPLLFSEFKSISQLAYITIITAVIALLFDIIFLPYLLKKCIK